MYCHGKGPFFVEHRKYQRHSFIICFKPRTRRISLQPALLEERYLPWQELRYQAAGPAVTPGSPRHWKRPTPQGHSDRHTVPVLLPRLRCPPGFSVPTPWSHSTPITPR